MDDAALGKINLCLRGKSVPPNELVVSVLSYSQVTRNADDSPIKPQKQGFNRDAAKASVATPDFAVCAVADGVSLRYWSEVAAKAAVQFFVTYFERFIWTCADKELTVEELKAELVQAVLQTNQHLIDFTHPATGEVVSIDENGGQTTLVVALVFPIPNRIPLQSNSWGVLTLSMGDSEANIFRFRRSEEDDDDDDNVGDWIQLCGDKGGRMLPFRNLKESQIKPPEFHILDSDGILFLFSDGVRDSFADKTLPSLPREVRMSGHSASYLLQKTRENFVKNGETDPDDVTLIAVSTQDTSEGGFLYSEYPHRELPLDLTADFFPEFCSKSAYDQNLVQEYIRPDEPFQEPKLRKKVKHLNEWLLKKTTEKQTKKSKEKKLLGKRKELRRAVTSPIDVKVTANAMDPIDQEPEANARETIEQIELQQEIQDEGKRAGAAKRRASKRKSFGAVTRPRTSPVLDQNRKKFASSWKPNDRAEERRAFVSLSPVSRERTQTNFSLDLRQSDNIPLRKKARGLSESSLQVKQIQVTADVQTNFKHTRRVSTRPDLGFRPSASLPNSPTRSSRASMQVEPTHSVHRSKKRHKDHSKPAEERDLFSSKEEDSTSSSRTESSPKRQEKQGRRESSASPTVKRKGKTTDTDEGENITDQVSEVRIKVTSASSPAIRTRPRRDNINTNSRSEKKEKIPSRRHARAATDTKPGSPSPKAQKTSPVSVKLTSIGETAAPKPTQNGSAKKKKMTALEELVMLDSQDSEHAE